MNHHKDNYKHHYHVGYSHGNAHKHTDVLGHESAYSQSTINVKKQLNENHQNAYKPPFFLILAFAVVELFGGVLSQSLALLNYTWHMFSGVFALGLA